MISISPALIKPLMGIAAVAAIFFYGKHLYDERNAYKDNYEQEVKNHQETANSRLIEQINARKAHEEALALEKKFNELRKKNSEYAACIANGTCGVRVRSGQSQTRSNTNTAAGSKPDDSSGGIEFTVQQDIFSLRTSIEIDEMKITGLQDYINKWCYKPQ